MWLKGLMGCLTSMHKAQGSNSSNSKDEEVKFVALPRMQRPEDVTLVC